ncbi:MAG: DUF5063 domain-containing protein [Pseudomonadota bacterium]
MDQSLARFAELARAYCHWAEGMPASAQEDAKLARLHLARLYAQALELSEGECGDDPREISHEAWRCVFERFGALPVNYYGTCFSPSIIPAESSIGDLADDLADIWRDLKEGLSLFDAGHVDAAQFEWRLHFNIHWGRHAASALYVLQCWAGESPHGG